MKNTISIILNGVLIVAVGILYYLHFSKPEPPVQEVKLAEAEQESKKDTVVIAEKVELPDLEQVSPARIAYVNLQELRTKLKFVLNEEKRLEQQIKNREQELKDRRETLLEEIQNFEQSAAMMTEQGIKEKQEKLAQQQDQWSQDMQEFQRDVMIKDQEFTSGFLAKIDNYLKDLSKEKNYTYVFTYDKGNASTIVFANDSLDITSQVIQGMNARYK